MATLLQPALLRRRIAIRGIVQGVGFRPFVFNLATSVGIGGFILNSSSGVTIEAEAAEAALDYFLECLRTQAPPLARIEEIQITDLEALGDKRFEIRESRASQGEFVLVSPEVATCEECLRELETRRIAVSLTPFQYGRRGRYYQALLLQARHLEGGMGLRRLAIPRFPEAF